MKKLFTGNEAIARGVYEAGVVYASSYPGTPSTEILDNIAKYKDDILAEWANNEKVAMEAVTGASILGARTFSSAKHVGINVASDPLFAAAYSGVNGGMVVVTCDEPGQHSSQNEQDNRHYAEFAKIPMFEPASSQECKDMVVEAYELSEKYDCPVFIRMTTRVCHSKGIVECGERKEVGIKEYVKNAKKYVTVPVNSKVRRRLLEERMIELKKVAENSPLNISEIVEGSKVGIITSGMCYNYAKEVFGDDVSYLKIGFSYPLPSQKIKDFCERFDEIYVLEENDMYLEKEVRILGFDCKGNNFFPFMGEMTPDRIRKVVAGKNLDAIDYEKDKVVPRPPALCAGCPHRGFYYELGKRKDIIVAGDIGCYSLAWAEPYNAMDFNTAMGGAPGLAHGGSQVLKMKGETDKRIFATIGDSTFFHTGINGLIDMAYNGSNAVLCILDNRITAMTGHQQNPGSGYTLQGKETKILEIEPIVKSCGIDHVRTINPNDLKEVNEAIDWALAIDGPVVIITRWPCVLKKLSAQDKNEFDNVFKTKNTIDQDKCIGCKKCTSVGCPAIIFDKDKKKARIDSSSCVGCDVCSQVCPVGAIVKEEK